MSNYYTVIPLHFRKVRLTVNNQINLTDIVNVIGIIQGATEPGEVFIHVRTRISIKQLIGQMLQRFNDCLVKF